MRFGGLVIDTVVCLTLAKWETVSGQFGGYLITRRHWRDVLVCEARLGCDRHTPLGCRLLAVPLSRPQGQLIVPRRKPGRGHDEPSELICNRSIKWLRIAQ